MGGKSSKSKKPKDAAPLDVLVEGAIIFLTSKASGKLRVNEGNLDVSARNALHTSAASCVIRAHYLLYVRAPPMFFPSLLY